MPDLVTALTAAPECIPFCAVSALVSAWNSCKRVGERQRKVQVVARVVVHRAVEHVGHAERQPAGQRVRLPAVAAAHRCCSRSTCTCGTDAGRYCSRSAGLRPFNGRSRMRLLSITCADAEVSRFDHLHVRLDGDRFGDFAERQGDRHDLVGVHLQHNAGLHGGPEPCNATSRLVGTDRDPGKREQAVGIGHDLALEPGIGLRRGDAGAREDAAARILDRPGDLRGGLGQGARGREDDEQTATQPTAQNALHCFLLGGKSESSARERK